MEDVRTEQFINHMSKGSNALQYITSEILRGQLFAGNEKYKDPRNLAARGHRVYSQNDEDGIIAEILRRIGCETGQFAEFGVGNGLENNTMYLLMRGWRGTWIDCDDESLSAIRDHHAKLIAGERLRVEKAFITAETVQGLFDSYEVPRDLDLLSIDIDGNDYWVWKALVEHNPKVVVIEYNAGMGPEAEWKMKYNPEWVWRGTRNCGASLKSLELLGRDKGYRLVGCSVTGMNAFFVREDLVKDRFQEPFTSEHHFEPARYHMWTWTGHRKDYGEIQSFGE